MTIESALTRIRANLHRLNFHRTHSVGSYPRCLTNSGGRRTYGCRFTSTVANMANFPRGRGLQGRGRGFDMGSITVPDRALQRQKKPSVTHVFCKLRPSFSLSRQRSRVRAPSSPPYIPEELIGIGGINWGAKEPQKCVPFAPRFNCALYIRSLVSWRSELRVRLRFSLGRKDKRHDRRLGSLLCGRNCLGVDI